MKMTLVATVASLLLVACTTNELEPSPVSVGVNVTMPAPEFDLTSLAGGTISSEDLKDKVLVVDFWATWCAPCIAEIPAYNALHSEQDSDTFAMLAVTVRSGSFEDVFPHVAKLEIEYPVVMGTEEVVQGFGGVIGWPTTYVVGPDWQIYKKYLGQTPGKKQSIEQDILDLTGSVDTASLF